jgi:Rrf2 family protein
MRISTRGRYALKMMVDIARHGGGERPVSLSTVAERTGISHGYLEQIAPALRAASLVTSVAGRHGGYRLAIPASKITIRQVIEASIGPIRVVDCVEDPDSCRQAESCECRVIYELINRRITQVLDGFTLEDLSDPSWTREKGVGGGRPPLGIEELPSRG